MEERELGCCHGDEVSPCVLFTSSFQEGLMYGLVSCDASAVKNRRRLELIYCECCNIFIEVSFLFHLLSFFAFLLVGGGLMQNRRRCVCVEGELLN